MVEEIRMNQENEPEPKGIKQNLERGKWPGSVV